MVILSLFSMNFCFDQQPWNFRLNEKATETKHYTFIFMVIFLFVVHFFDLTVLEAMA